MYVAVKNSENVAMEAQQGVCFLVASLLTLPTYERHAGLLCSNQILIFSTDFHERAQYQIKGKLKDWDPR
jgi:hypothetical protein